MATSSWMIPAQAVADRKLSLAVDLLLAADLHADQSRVQVAAKVQRVEDDLNYPTEDEQEAPIPQVDSTQPVRNAFQALDLVSPGIAAAAQRLYMATTPLGALADRWPDPRFDSDQHWTVNGSRPTTSGLTRDTPSWTRFVPISG